MRIAIISDIHDALPNLAAALTRLADTEALICCGDLCSPFVVARLGQGFTRPIHIVFGNNDGDLFRITQQASRFPHVTLHGELAELSLGGKRLAVNHYPEIARGLAASGRYDVVCFGHNHTYEVTREGTTWLVNPGEVFGGLSGHATCATYDSGRDQVNRHDLGA